MKGTKLMFALGILGFGVYVFFWGSEHTADVTFRTRERIARYDTELELGVLAVVGLLGMMGLRVHPSIVSDDDNDGDDGIDDS